MFTLSNGLDKGFSILSACQILRAFVGLMVITSSAWGAEITVEIDGYTARPELLTAKTGDTVTWVVKDPLVPHEVTSYSGEFDSPVLDKVGASFSTVLNVPSTIAYRHYASRYRGEPGGILYVLPPDTNSITITTPIDGARFSISENSGLTLVDILATSQTASNAIARVEFYSGANLLSIATSSPYRLLWTNAPLGTHAVFAKQVNVDGASSTSVPVSVVVEEHEGPFVYAPRVLRGGVFACNYTFSVGGRFSVFDITASPLEYNELHPANDDLGFGIILSSINSNEAHLFFVRQRF